MEVAIEQCKALHWQDLASEAGKIVSIWRNYCLGPTTIGDYIVDEDVYFSETDGYLTQALLLHLKAEFTEFIHMEDWRDLFKKGIPKGALSSLRLVAKRRSFEGTCRICQSWNEATPVTLQPIDVVNAYLEIHKNN